MRGSGIKKNDFYDKCKNESKKKKKNAFRIFIVFLTSLAFYHHFSMKCLIKQSDIYFMLDLSMFFKVLLS